MKGDVLGFELSQYSRKGVVRPQAGILYDLIEALRKLWRGVWMGGGGGGGRECIEEDVEDIEG